MLDMIRQERCLFIAETLTLDERKLLQAVIDGQRHVKTNATIDTLYDLGLVTRHHGCFMATDSGYYVAKVM